MYKQRIEGAGGIYLVVRKFEDYLDFLTNPEVWILERTPGETGTVENVSNKNK